MPGTSNFPISLDTFPGIDANTQEDATGVEHDVVHENVHAAIAAVQQRLGIDESTDPDSFDYKLAVLFASVALKTSQSRTIDTTAPLAGGGDLSANRTLSIAAASTGAAGSMSSADKTKLDGVASGATAYTDAAARSAVVIDSLSSSDATHAPSRKAVFDALAGVGGGGSIVSGYSEILVTGAVGPIALTTNDETDWLYT